MIERRLMISCEHGGNEIPCEYVHLFGKAEEIIESHRGYDYGAIVLYNLLKDLADYSDYATTCRLLVDLNRSLHHPNLFSEFTKDLRQAEKDTIIREYYNPYRSGFASFAQKSISEGCDIMLLSVHSFTPIIDGKVRNTDIGILFDPAQKTELNFARRLKRSFNKNIPYARVRFNYPYKGKPDGHVAYFRRLYGTRFTGIELEIGYNMIYPEMLNLIAKSVKLLFVSNNKCG